MKNWISWRRYADELNKPLSVKVGNIEPSLFCGPFPQVGPLRSALIVATVDTPHRFRTKRQLWSYSGLAVVTHMSSEYQIQEDRVIGSRKPIATRGLNRNCNHRMKDVFIGAATGGAQIEPYRTYLERLEQTGMRAEMARLTLARKIAAVALSIWKKGEVFDPKKLNWTT
jgi:transposase